MRKNNRDSGYGRSFELSQQDGEEDPFLKQYAPQPPPRRRIPFFIILVTLVQIGLLAYAIYLNHGIEKLTVNPFVGPSLDTLNKLGAKNVTLIREGQWYRLFIPMMLHVGVIHLIVNLLFQVRTGSDLERDFGTIKIAFIYIVSGFFSNVASSIFLPSYLTVGASGALFSLLGVICVDMVKNWQVVYRPIFNCVCLIISLAISFTIGFLPFVDNYCHLGGFICGIFLGSFLIPHRRFEDDRGYETLDFVIVDQYLTKKNVCFIIFGFVGFTVMAAGSLYLFYSDIDMQEACPWCERLHCLINIAHLCDNVQN